MGGLSLFTVTMPSVWQAWPLRAPLLHVPGAFNVAPLHFGQTVWAGVVHTSEFRWIEPVNSPVCTFATDALMVASAYLLTTQTGIPPATSGSGGPKFGPFSEPAPPTSVVPVPVHTGLVLSSQPDRQSLTVVPWGTGKLWDTPDQPLSRSDPVVTRRSSWSGPPCGFAVAQSGGGTTLSVV